MMKIHHLGYLVKDMEEAIARFQALGFHIERDKFYVKERMQWNVFMLNDATRIELIQPEQNQDAAQKANAANLKLNLPGGVGPYHMGFESSNFDEDVKEILGNGFMPISRVEREDAYLGARMQFFFSNKVGIVEVIEMVQK